MCEPASDPPVRCPEWPECRLLHCCDLKCLKKGGRECGGCLKGYIYFSSMRPHTRKKHIPIELNYRQTRHQMWVIKVCSWCGLHILIHHGHYYGFNTNFLDYLSACVRNEWCCHRKALCNLYYPVTWNVPITNIWDSADVWSERMTFSLHQHSQVSLFRFH